jgi:tRNA threonylcarbamoyladenosine biosynthesis protein TsaB
MRLLLMDTCGAEGSVALADMERDQALVVSEVLPGRSASERLLTVIRSAMDAAGWRLKELAAVVVVSGPGSFTGVRVGLSAAKGLSEASGVPVIAVSRLALLAGLADAGEQTVFAVLDAGRGEFYVGEYVGRRCVREALMERAELEGLAAGGIVVACEASVVEALAGLGITAVRCPGAADALGIAVERAAKSEFDDVASIDANYLRRTDAQIFAKPKQKGTAS